MEFSYSKSRSNAPCNVINQQKLGLLILATSNPYCSPTHIVFSTRNLTKVIFQTNAPLSSTSSSSSIPNNLDISEKSPSPSPSPAVAVGDDNHQETPGTGHSFTKPLLKKPCLLSSNYMPQTNNYSLPLTTCVKHGTAGFMPLDYARKLPEYTCTTQIFPVHRVVHSFDDCVLEFPDDSNTYTTNQTPLINRQDQINVIINKCSRCEKELSDRDDIYMYRDDMFCSSECRYEVRTFCFSCDKSDEEDEEEVEFSDVSSMGDDTVFTIDYFS